MYNKTIIEFGFCDIWNNQGLGKCNQPRPPASADYTCLDLDYSGYHKNLIQLLFIIHNTEDTVKKTESRVQFLLSVSLSSCVLDST